MFVFVLLIEFGDQKGSNFIYNAEKKWRNENIVFSDKFRSKLWNESNTFITQANTSKWSSILCTWWTSWCLSGVAKFRLCKPYVNFTPTICINLIWTLGKPFTRSFHWICIIASIGNVESYIVRVWSSKCEYWNLFQNWLWMWKVKRIAMNNSDFFDFHRIDYSVPSVYGSTFISTFTYNSQDVHA